ncbi:hypothetical protein [Microcoleus sp. Pol12B5]|uniref:hypothetical protein n=1 Tax=Microcoleus sp. Pol12B5 TaxID=3055396 RepID=UPI002FD5ABC5
MLFFQVALESIFNVRFGLISDIALFVEQAEKPVPQRVNFLVEQAEKPVHKKLIDNGATSQSYPRVQLLGATVCFSLRDTATQDGNTYLKIGEHRSAPPRQLPTMTIVRGIKQLPLQQSSFLMQGIKIYATE